MAQWAKALATKPDNVSSIVGTYMVEEENPLTQNTDPHTFNFRKHLRITCKAREMAQWVKVLARQTWRPELDS